VYLFYKFFFSKLFFNLLLLPDLQLTRQKKREVEEEEKRSGILLTSRFLTGDNDFI